MYHVTKNTGLDEIKGECYFIVGVIALRHLPTLLNVDVDVDENILYHMHHVKPILLVWLLALWEGCVDAEKHTCTVM